MAPKKKKKKGKTTRARSSKPTASAAGASLPLPPEGSPPPTPPLPSDLPFPSSLRIPPTPIAFSFSGASHPPPPADSPIRPPFAGSSHPPPPDSPTPIPPLPFDYPSIPQLEPPPAAAARPRSEIALTVARHTARGAAAAARERLSSSTAEAASLEQGLERLGHTLPTMMSTILSIQDLVEETGGDEELVEAGLDAFRNMETIQQLFETTRNMVREKTAAAEQGGVDFSRDLREGGDRGGS
ncbi:sulfated surface glycoprotein 185-like [Zingiber officinale]|uniref:sulfated surface glycoprotein 185-like n=1 Tax=Zingiber officinale TaxID=94328 RepID=UPI001C4D490F|nr:sulfated surface glycoprotein 185-like [Zingiber officinale]